MISRRRIQKALDNPRLIPIKLWSVFNRAVLGRGENVMSKDWDNLIILDACRYDLFQSSNTIQGELDSIYSIGSHTGEFLEKTFGGEEYLDTIYVTATPQAKLHGVDDAVLKCIHVWENNWHEELRTVTAEDVAAKARIAQDEYPNKRLIVHFIQPHYPFIGPTGRELPHRTISGEGLTADESAPSIWDRLENGDYDSETVWKAYEENLEIILPTIEDLVDDLNGKTVVTSDHGNAFGKFGIYGHPGGVFLNELVEVPWLVVAGNERREFSVDTEKQSGEREQVTPEVQARLTELGYK